MTPLVVRSEYPKVTTVDVPWWWSRDDEAQLRHRLEKVSEGGDVSKLETVDHGVVSAPMATVRSGLVRPGPAETAMSGLTRVGNHSKDGFGECRVNTVTPDEPTLNKQIQKPNSEH